MTTTKEKDIRQTLNETNLNRLAEALAKIKAGNAASKIKVTFASLTSSATIDITTAASKAAGTISGITLATGENLPPIGQVVALRVTAGTATAGDRHVSDVGGTAAAPHAAGVPGIATLSDDGTTLVFEAAVTGFVLVYYPAPYVALNTSFPITAP